MVTRSALRVINAKSSQLNLVNTSNEVVLRITEDIIVYSFPLSRFTRNSSYILLYLYTFVSIFIYFKYLFEGEKVSQTFYRKRYTLQIFMTNEKLILSHGISEAFRYSRYERSMFEIELRYEVFKKKLFEFYICK